jgi:hypothetical protein
MKGEYVHILLDKDPGGKEGQEICTNCKLSLPQHLESWEDFLNGEFVYGEPPKAEGYYPVHVPHRKETLDPGDIFKVTVKQIILHARPAIRKKNVFVWSDPKVGAKVVARWSRPIPFVWVDYIPFFKRGEDGQCDSAGHLPFFMRGEGQ